MEESDKFLYQHHLDQTQAMVRQLVQQKPGDEAVYWRGVLRGLEMAHEAYHLIGKDSDEKNNQGSAQKSEFDDAFASEGPDFNS